MKNALKSPEKRLSQEISGRSLFLPGTDTSIRLSCLPLAGTAGWQRLRKAWGGQGAGGTACLISGCPLGLHSLAAGLLTGEASKSCPVLFVSEPVSPRQCGL